MEQARRVRRHSERPLRRPPSLHTQLALAETPSGQVALRLEAVIVRIRQTVGFKLLEIDEELEVRGPFPILILDALVKKKLAAITTSGAVLEARRDATG